MSSVRFRSALKKLETQGVDALKPKKLPLSENNVRNGFKWQAPVISKRVASVLRKQAIKEGTFGSFTDGRGWDPAWDVELAKQAAARRPDQAPKHYYLAAPKKTKYVRNREERAQKIEKNMEDMDERMHQYWADKQAKKPSKTVENMCKEMMKS